MVWLAHFFSQGQLEFELHYQSCGQGLVALFLGHILQNELQGLVRKIDSEAQVQAALG